MANFFLNIKNISQQRGYLSIIVAFLLVLMGVLSATAVYIQYGSVMGTTDSLLGMQAFYLAEGGLERAQRALKAPIFSNRVTCAGLSGSAPLTNIGLGNGTFSVTTTGSAPTSASSSVQTGLDSSSTTIPVSSVASFTAPGRILIDKEIITFTRTSGNNFIGAKRGAAGTVAANHSFGSLATQYQCNLVSEGGVPSVASSIGNRTVSETAQLQFGVVIGNRNGNVVSASQWNRPTEKVWTANNFDLGNARENFNGVSLLSYNDGWAVGNTRNGNYSIARFNGSTWSAFTVTGSNNLFGVSAVSSIDAWAVGASGRILRWNGSTWINITSPTTNQLNSVSMLDTTGSGTANIGWAVGANGTIIRYTGTWSTITSPTTQTLNHVFTVSANEAWAVGASGTVLRWNGSAWSLFADIGTATLNGIYMLDTNNDGIADDGWFVGAGGVAYRYISGSWVAQTLPPFSALSCVAAFAGDDVWACGASSQCVHWDGSSWTSFATGSTAAQINDISIIETPLTPRSNWQEIFP